jgi:hypothetical protein
MAEGCLGYILAPCDGEAVRLGKWERENEGTAGRVARKTNLLLLTSYTHHQPIEHPGMDEIKERMCFGAVIWSPH